KAPSHAAESESRDLQVALSEPPLLHGAPFTCHQEYSGPVLFVADLLHPVDGLAVELFHNRDVRHGRGWRRAVPMLLTRRAPDHVTGPNLLDRTAPALHQAAAGRHDQCLTQRMGVPRG